MYTWVSQKASAGDTYADDYMMLVALPTSAATAAEMYSLSVTGQTVMTGSCTDITTGGTLIPKADTCYKINFDTSLAETRFTIDATGVSNIVFVAQHFPTEFEKDTHYLLTGTEAGGAGVESRYVEPLFQRPAAIEWSGVFAMPDASYTWLAQKKGGKYADDTMVLAAIPASAATEAALDGLEAKGKAAFKKTCTVVTKGQTITPAENVCYLLTFDQAATETRFAVDNAAGSANIAFFAQHFPTEFEEDTHYLLKTSDPCPTTATEDNGCYVEPAHQEAASGGAVGHTHAADYDHGLPCGCEKDEADHPFVIDCADAATIRAAMTTMGSCEKSTCKTNKECQVAFFVLQAHHDYCDHDALHYEEEVMVHAFENDCTNCQIFRKHKAGNPKCFFEAHQAEASCKDTSSTVSALATLKAECTPRVKDGATVTAEGACCESDLTIGAFATIVAYHDLCDPNDVPEAVEVAFHDYEHQCANHMCNAVDANYDGTTCPAGGVYEFDANGFKGSTPVDSHAGVITLIFAILAADFR
jgi:hypothetical protein